MSVIRAFCLPFCPKCCQSHFFLLSSLLQLQLTNHCKAHQQQSMSHKLLTLHAINPLHSGFEQYCRRTTEWTSLGRLRAEVKSQQDVPLMPPTQ